MPSLDTPVIPKRKDFNGFLGGIYHHLNFFRVHLLLLCVRRIPLWFYRKLIHSLHSTFVPLIFSAILYASNGENYVSYPDALFLCVSAATVTGLATIDLSSMTAWQQIILFILMFFGSPVSQTIPCFSL